MKLTLEEWLEWHKGIRWDAALEHAKRLVWLLDDIAWKAPEVRGPFLARMAAEVEDIARALRLGEDSPTKDKRGTVPEVEP